MMKQFLASHWFVFLFTMTNIFAKYIGVTKAKKASTIHLILNRLLNYKNVRVKPKIISSDRINQKV